MWGGRDAMGEAYFWPTTRKQWHKMPIRYSPTASNPSVNDSAWRVGATPIIIGETTMQQKRTELPTVDRENRSLLSCAGCLDDEQTAGFDSQAQRP